MTQANLQDAFVRAALNRTTISQGFPAASTIVVGGQSAPGRWTLIDAEKEYGWQIQQGYGLSGATVTPSGDKLVVAKFEVVVWYDVQPASVMGNSDPFSCAGRDNSWQAFKKFRAKFLSKAVVVVNGTFSGKAMDVLHPELNELGVRSFVPLKLPAMKQDDYGLWHGEVHLLQYRQPVPVLSRPDATIPDIGQPQPSAQDAADAANQQAAADLQSRQ